MAVGTDAEEPIRACPNCGQDCENVLRDVYECEEHGVFQASDPDPDDESEASEQGVRGTAD